MKHFFIFLCILILFFWRYSVVEKPDFPQGTKIRITANLKEQPQFAGNIQRFNLAGIKIITWKYPEYYYGDKLIVTGVIKNNSLEMPEIEIRPAFAEASARQRKLDIGYWILELRNRMDEMFKRNLPEPQASLLSGIVLGIKSNLPKDFYQNLLKTGTMHIIVASGMNVALISGTILDLLLKFFSRKKAIILSIILIWFYVVLAGGDVPVVRAGMMGSVILIAQLLGREPDALRALLVAAILILIGDPTSLNDIGFQLSFAATLGIVLLSKKTSTLFFRLPKQVKSDMGQILSAQLFTLPIILINFGYYSLISIPVNLLVVWPLIWILRLGLLGGLVGLLIPSLGSLICILILPLLTYFVKIIGMFSSI